MCRVPRGIPILDTAALYVDDRTTPFDVYCARTHTRKLYLVGEHITMPAEAGTLPARRSLRVNFLGKSLTKTPDNEDDGNTSAITDEEEHTPLSY